MPETPPNASTFASSSSSEEKFLTLQRWQTVGRVQVFGTALIVAGLFGNFAYRTYHDVVGGFTQERTQRAVENAIPVIAPSVTKVLKDVIAEVLPEYRRQAGERYEPLRAKLTASATSKFESLPQQSGTLLTESLHRALERAVARVGPEVNNAFPSLADAGQRALLATKVHDAIEARNLDLASQVEALGVTEATRIHAILEKFDLADTADGRSDEQLHQDLVRTLMLLAEQELEFRTNPGASDKPLAAADGF